MFSTMRYSNKMPFRASSKLALVEKKKEKSRLLGYVGRFSPLFYVSFILHFSHDTYEIK